MRLESDVDIDLLFVAAKTRVAQVRHYNPMSGVVVSSAFSTLSSHLTVLLTLKQLYTRTTEQTIIRNNLWKTESK